MVSLSRNVTLPFYLFKLISQRLPLNKCVTIRLGNVGIFVLNAIKGFWATPFLQGLAQACILSSLLRKWPHLYMTCEIKYALTYLGKEILTYY